MAKKAKGNRVQVILECTEHKNSGMPGTSRYVTTKNRKSSKKQWQRPPLIATLISIFICRQMLRLAA